MDELTPEHVEMMIERAGRSRVFARARELGWGGSQPPLWVWQQIAIEVMATPEPEPWHANLGSLGKPN